MEQTESIKILGVNLDDELNFRDHIPGMCKKVGGMIEILRRLKNLIPVSARLLLYKSVILPHLTYCHLGRVRLGSIRNKNKWNNAKKRLFGSYSHSGIPGFPFLLFCSQEQNRWNKFRNIFLFRNIPNERALSVAFLFGI